MSVPIQKRILNRVTITGADESIDPYDLIDIYDSYPFVEWGILMSSSSWPNGRNRFPSSEWLRELYNLSAEEDRFYEIGGWIHVKKFPMSCHLCGSWASSVFSGEWKHLQATGGFIPNMFLRYQLNTHGTKQKKYNNELMVNALKAPWFKGRQIIIQMDDANNYIFDEIKDQVVSAPLFDLSHGAGILPKGWPIKPEGRYCGYAGGLSPENLEEQMELIFESAGRGPVWIDAETHLRTEDEEFDLDKVKDFLEAASQWVIGKE